MSVDLIRTRVEASMKRFVLVGTLVAALGATTAFAQKSGGATGSALGSVHLAKKVMADGKPLAAGTYQVRLTSDEPKPGVGQAQGAERYVEFLRSGKVAGREVASVVSAEDIGKIAKGKKPGANSSSVELLKGGDYYRVWINRGGTNYIINMPPG
jgi:hypothetical protein